MKSNVFNITKYIKVLILPNILMMCIVKSRLFTILDNVKYVI